MSLMWHNFESHLAAPGRLAIAVCREFTPGLAISGLAKGINGKPTTAPLFALPVMLEGYALQLGSDTANR